jgi:hypothetical protein
MISKYPIIKYKHLVNEKSIYDHNWNLRTIGKPGLKENIC